jgi:hypothetical protein
MFMCFVLTDIHLHIVAVDSKFDYATNIHNREKLIEMLLYKSILIVKQTNKLRGL